jgi:photosystem II stability/assembly factor-like uncharacterized protein
MRLAVVAALCAGMACAATTPTPPAAAPAGVAAVLAERALAPAQPQRTMLLGLARAGQRLVAVGEHGGVALSDDNGASWRNAAAVPVDATLTAVRFANARVGWAVGHLGVVLHTEDGGEHWRRQLDGIALARLATAQAKAGDNADRSEIAADAQRLVEDGPDKPWLDLLVDDDQHLTLVGAFNLALRSDDGGRQWRVVSQQFTNPNRLHWYGITRLGGRQVGVGEQALIAVQTEARTDAPLKAIKSPYDGSLFGVLATGEQSLLVYGLRGHAFVSTDGGASWQRAQLAGGGASLNAGLRLADGRIALADQAGNLFLSADGGAHFERVPFAWGAPLTGIAEAADGSLVLTSLGGIAAVPKGVLAQVKSSPRP